MLKTKPALPQPDSAALFHSEQLKQLIMSEIKQEGAISFARYMELALYAPGFGYYSAGTRKFGADGDFVTAPEISPLFSYCLARQCQQVLQLMPNADILELGAGSGIMALDILTELERQNYLPNHYYILETSADLKSRQQELLQKKAPHFFERITWLDSLPQKLNGIILANEVLDALPVHKFKIEEEVKEFFVTIIDNDFAWQLSSANADFKAAVQKLSSFTKGYESEINLLLQPWLKSLNNCLQQGIILFIDYGFPRREYYHPDRNRGTLMCHYRHHAHSDPLFLPGLQDITAHVDFTALAEAATLSGLSLSGYTTQAAFLISCGIGNYIENITDSEQRFKIAQEIKKLTLPSEMGELFKTIAFAKNITTNLIGFTFHDMQEKLE